MQQNLNVVVVVLWFVIVTPCSDNVKRNVAILSAARIWCVYPRTAL